MVRVRRIRELPTPWLLLWGLTLCLFTNQPWSYSLGSLPLQVLFVWMLLPWLVLAAPGFTHSLKLVLTPTQFVLIGIILLFIVLRAFSGDLPWLRVYQLLTGIVMLFVAAYAMTDNKGVKYTVWALILAAGLSGAVAVLQYLGLAGWTWRRTVYYGTGVYMPTGLEAFPVSFSYSVVGVAIVAVAGALIIWQNKHLKLDLPKAFILLGFGALIGIGVLLSQSRSGVLGVIAGIVVVAIGARYLRLRFIPLPIIFVGLFCLMLLFIFKDSALVGQVFNKTANSNIQEDMRLTETWKLFMPIIFQYPLGIPEGIYSGTDSSFSYSGSASVEFAEVLKKTDGYDPHNIFLTASLFLGLPVSISLMLLYFSLFSGAAKAIQIFKYRKQYGYAVMALLLLAANVGLLVHAWFHNANIAFGEMRGWFWLGALMAFSGILLKKRPVYNKNLSKNPSENLSGNLS